MDIKTINIEFMLEWKDLSFNAQERLIDYVIGHIKGDENIMDEIKNEVQEEISPVENEKKYTAQLELAVRNRALKISKNLRQYVDLGINQNGN